MRRETVFIWCDISISCICAYPACGPCHCGISRAVVQSRLTWSDCLSMIEALYCFPYTPRLLFFLHWHTWFDWFVLIWGLVRRETVFIWCDISISCICAYPACGPCHCGISRAVVQSRLTWSDCLSMIEALCMTHVCLVYDSRMPCVWLNAWLAHDVGFDLPSFRSRGDFYIHLFVHR